MSTSERGYHHGDLRASLIAETIKMVGDGEFANITMRKLAERLGVSRTAPYRHFADKDALFAAVAEEGFARMEACIDELLEGSAESLRDRFVQMGVAYMMFAIENEGHYTLMFGDNSIRYEDHPKVYEAGENAYRALFRMVRQCQSAGIINNPDAVHITNVVWSAGHGFANLVNRGFITVENVRAEAERMAHSIGNGLFSESG